MSSSWARHHAAQSLVPLVQPKVKRSIKSTDTEPAFTHNKDGVCLVCRECEYRYTCPKCQMPYCSVACYKLHDEDGTSCTESFYQNRVSTVLNYEAKEQHKSIQQILSRSHQQMLTEFDDNEEDNDVSEEDLWRLAEALENDTVTEEDTVRLLTPELRMAFERAVQNGELDEVVEPWHPWWMPELVSTATVTEQSRSTPKKTLDERLLKIPSFQTLRSGSDVPVLIYNAIDLLYSIACTLRLYHGVDNAMDVCRDSCQTLIRASAVLCEDARYSSVAEALMACTSVGTSIQTNKSNIYWTVLAQDVAYLVSASRHMSHALLEAIDILKAAVKEFKDEGEAEDANRMRRTKKKLEYYLSWSREASIPDNLESEIREWIEEWSGLIDNESDSLVLPNANDQRRRGPRESESESGNRRTEPSDSLMIEVSSRRKDDEIKAT